MMLTRIVLQERLTGKFLGANGDWTHTVSEARSFVDVPSAVNAACMGDLVHTEVVIQFPPPGGELRLPLSGRISEFTAQG